MRPKDDRAFHEPVIARPRQVDDDDAPTESWWLCEDADFASRVLRERKRIRASKFGQMAGIGFVLAEGPANQRRKVDGADLSRLMIGDDGC